MKQKSCYVADSLCKKIDRFQTIGKQDFVKHKIGVLSLRSIRLLALRG